MPLQITASIPIVPQSPPPPILLPLGGAADILSPPDELLPLSHVLEINAIPQDERQWCWAACIEMVLAKTDSPLKQCKILSQLSELHAADCCDRKDDFKETSLKATRMRAAWKAFGVIAMSHLGTADDKNGRVLFVKVQEEIQAGRPIEVAVEWFEGGSHALLIKGFGQIGTEPIVWINDPLADKSHFRETGEGPILFSELENAHNYGAWVCTWTGLGKTNV